MNTATQFKHVRDMAYKYGHCVPKEYTEYILLKLLSAGRE